MAGLIMMHAIKLRECGESCAENALGESENTSYIKDLTFIEKQDRLTGKSVGSLQELQILEVLK
jgi:hypothetical protein